MRSVELTGRVDENGRFYLNEPLVALTPGEYRILLLVGQGLTSEQIAEQLQTGRDWVILLMSGESDISEKEWLSAAAGNPAFRFLEDTAEDIYTPADGLKKGP